MQKIAITNQTGYLKSALSNKKTVLSTVIVISLVLSFATCFFSTPTVFGGRDQGAIATAAINLAKNKSLLLSTPISGDLFQKYGPGRALNFPGFDYTKNGKLISRFPKAYIAYLAAAFASFGLAGIQYANFLPLFLFLVLFWLTLRLLFPEKTAFAGYLLAATFFPFLWFTKYTLTEIFMLFLVWAGIYFLIRLQYPASKDSDAGSFYPYAPFVFFALSALTRIEGIVFFLLAAVYVIILEKRKSIVLPKNFRKILFVAAILLLVLYATLNLHDLTDSAKNIVKSLLPNFARESAPSTNLYAYLFRIFTNYGLLPYLALGFAGIYLALSKAERIFEKPEAGVMFVLFPSFVYLLFPLITLDDPWLLRRFVFAVFPALIFYSVFALNRIMKSKGLASLVFLALITLNISMSALFFGRSENRGLLSQTEKISEKFGRNDLILVDRLSSGNGFALLSEPLSSIFGKQAVYFFNAEDLNYVRKNNYESIYLVAPLTESGAWYDSLSKQLLETLTVKNNFLEPSTGYFDFARNSEVYTEVGIWKLN